MTEHRISETNPTVTSVLQPGATVFLQDACLQHRYIRSNDVSAIVERPERLRAVKIGLSAAIANLEQCFSEIARIRAGPVQGDRDGADELTAALQRMNLAQVSDAKVELVNLVKSTASVNLLDHPAVKYVHGDIDGDVYLAKLVGLTKGSEAKIARGESEIPEGLLQGDLYLCPGSLQAIEGALGTVCEAVDSVVKATRTDATGTTSDEVSNSTLSPRAFVAIRPPGHHCGEDTPSGFCFVNNVAVAAAHAHLTHGVTKVVILDIDLHHGNGTQSIVWQLNEETYRVELEQLEVQTSETTSRSASPKQGLKVYYGSIHDILSYPCEDGKAALVQAASISIHGPHGQYIENVHLQPYASEKDFHANLYPHAYSSLLEKAKDFIGDSQSDDVLVFISCGFDACEFEYPSMSRHNRKVPVSFYHRFAKDARAFADKYAKGKLISVLEGGYSDRALTSGAMAHLAGLVDTECRGIAVQNDWWSLGNLIKLEKATKRRRGGRISMPASGTTENWLERTLAIFSSIETVLTPSPSRTTAPLPPFTKTLRTRKAATSVSSSTTASPKKSSEKTQVKEEAEINVVAEAEAAFAALTVTDVAIPIAVAVKDPTPAQTSIEQVHPTDIFVPKKLPRVILRVRDPNDASKNT